MDKGLLIIIAIGVGIVYFATHFSGDTPVDSDITWSNTQTDHSLPYYKKDLLGNRVLNFSSIPLAEAKNIWPSTPTAQKIAATLPDFDLARLQTENGIVKGAFRQYVLKYLDKLEGKFIVGEIRSDQARKALLNFR